MHSGLSSAFRRLLRSVPREPAFLITALLIVAGTWVFIEVADEVLEGETQAFDEWAVKSLRSADDLSQPLGPHWMSGAAQDITALGSVSVLTLVIAAVAGFLWVRRAYEPLILLLVITISGMLLSSLLKLGFSRDRPDLVPHLSQVYTSSFPSGHSMMSAVVYLTLATIVSATVTARRMKVYLFAVASVAITLVGFSRVYLGVHYPTDVLAGWIAGIVWSLFSWMVVNRLLTRRAASTEKGVS